MPVCALSPGDKKQFGVALGSELARAHGKRRYYSAQQVRDSAQRLGYATDWHCWGMSMYLSPSDFYAFHSALGEVCDYVAMRSEMAAAIAGDAASSWFSVDLSWLEWPDIDFGDLFDIFD